MPTDVMAVGNTMLDRQFNPNAPTAAGQVTSPTSAGQKAGARSHQGFVSSIGLASVPEAKGI